MNKETLCLLHQPRQHIAAQIICSERMKLDVDQFADISMRLFAHKIALYRFVYC